MKTQVTVTQSAKVEKFGDLLNKGRECIQQAAEVLVEMVNENPRVYDEITKRFPQISYNVLTNLERVGRGQLLAALLFDTSPGARRLIAMPASQQREIYDKPIKVVRVEGSKKIVEEKSIQHLSPQEIRTVFDGNNHMRTVEEQMKSVAEALPRRTQNAERYQIFEGKLIVKSDTVFDVTTLEAILERIKAAEIKTLGSSMKKNQVRA